MAMVTVPIMTSVAIRFFAPNLIAEVTENMAPNGRAKKPTAKVANDCKGADKGTFHGEKQLPEY